MPLMLADLGRGLPTIVQDLSLYLSGKISRAFAGQVKLAVGTRQGLALVHFLVQRKRFLWDRGCV